MSSGQMYYCGGCGMWVYPGHQCPVHPPLYPLAPSTPNLGWECPRCHKIWAPGWYNCDCQPAEEDGPLNDEVTVTWPGRVFNAQATVKINHASIPTVDPLQLIVEFEGATFHIPLNPDGDEIVFAQEGVAVVGVLHGGAPSFGQPVEGSEDAR